MTDMLAEALYYAKRGWYVFPCREKPSSPFVRNGETVILSEKTPYVSKGLNDASIDEEQIKAWWKIWPDAMIGVNAGKSGLFVIDIDKKNVNGLDTFTKWNVNDTAGLHSFTPSGGMHIVFSGVGKSSTNANTGIDTRGEGGYFIAPPSKILEGSHVGEYKAFDDWSRDPGVIPDGLMAKLFPDKTVEYVRGNATSTIVGQKKQLSRATLNFLAMGAPEGERNTTLFKVVADFAGCGYAKEEVRQTVAPVCERIGLTRGELEQVIEHAFSKPRTSSIPDEIQEKIMNGGKNISSTISAEEQAVLEDVLLACLLIDNHLIPIINDILYYDDFQVFKNRIIYRAIIRLFNAGMKVDYFSVSSEVSKETDKINLNEISKLINQYYVNTDNVTTYALIIKEKASIRKIEVIMDNKEKYIKTGNLIEIVSTLEKDISDVALYGGAKSSNVLTSEQATDMVRKHTEMMVAGQIEQLRTGFLDYDYHIGGLYSHELIVCAGRSGDGKSALSLSIANNVAIGDKKPVLMFNLEMSTHESICRLICQLTGLSFKNVYQGKLDANGWKLYMDAMDRIKESPLYFDDSFGMTIPEIRSKIRKMQDNDIKLIIIDQLEQVKGYDTLPTHIKFDNLTYDIKDMAKEFNIPIILNHQLNRNTLDRKLKNTDPQIGDLNQAGEKGAHQVWAISHNKDESGNILQSKIRILKNRNGPKIEFAVVYLGERMLFANPSNEEEGRVFQSSNTDYDDSEPHWSKY